MREQFLVNNKPNVKYILCIGAASAIIYLLQLGEVMFRLFEDASGKESPFMYLSGFITPLASCFLYPFIWAWALSLAPARDMVKDIVVPAAALAVYSLFTMMITRMLGAGYTSGDQSLTSPDSIMYMSRAVGSVIVMVAFCEGLYDRFRNKLFLFFVGSWISGLLSIAVTYVWYDNVEGLVPGILSNAMYFVTEYFLACFILRSVQIPVHRILTPTQQQEHDIAQSLQLHVEKGESRVTTVTQVQEQFPSVPFNSIANAYTRTAPTERKLENKVTNGILIGTCLLSFAYAMYMGELTRSLSFSFYSWLEDLALMIARFFLLFVAIIRLKIATDMIDYKPYTYKTLGLFGLLSIVMSIFEVFWSGDSILLLVMLVINITLTIMAFRMSSSIYPDYALLFKQRYERPEDFGEQPSAT